MYKISIYTILVGLLFWYIGYAFNGAKTIKDISTSPSLSLSEFRELKEKGRYKGMTWERDKYFTKSTVEYNIVRTPFPFQYRRDTLYSSGVLYMYYKD